MIKEKSEKSIPTPVFDPFVKEAVLNNLRQRGYSAFKTKIRMGGFGKVETITAKHKGGLMRFVAEATTNIPVGDPVVEAFDKRKLVDYQWITYDLVVKKRSTGSGYVELHREKHITDIDGVAVFFGFYDHLVGNIERTGYPKPFTFAEEIKMVTTSEGTRFEACAQIRSVRAVSLVTINKGYTTVDILGNNLHEPNAKCWFLLCCIGHRGATFNIISDGEVFYPVSRVAFTMNGAVHPVQRVKIKTSVGRQSVNPMEISKADQRLILLAIKDWVYRFSS